MLRGPLALRGPLVKKGAAEPVASLAGKRIIGQDRIACECLGTECRARRVLEARANPFLKPSGVLASGRRTIGRVDGSSNVWDN